MQKMKESLEADTMGLSAVIVELVICRFSGIEMQSRYRRATQACLTDGSLRIKADDAVLGNLEKLSCRVGSSKLF